MSIDIKQADVIKLMLQFMRENGLDETFKTLQKETSIGLNIVESKESLYQDIKMGKWDQVLRHVQYVALPHHILIELYEQIIFELREIGDTETCHMLFKKAVQDVRSDYPERLARLDFIIKQKNHPKNEDLYGFQDPTMTKDKRRKVIADHILESIDTVKENRLLELLGQALKYQEIKGLIPTNIKLNVFLDKVEEKNYHNKDEFPSQISQKLEYPIQSKINCLKYSSNGGFVASGSNDGIIEILDSNTGKLKLDLHYQSEQNFMIHAHPITSLCISRDNELLASGDMKGWVKIWRIQSGKLLKKMQPFDTYISSLLFGRDISHLIVASDFIQVMGLKSGNSLKTFKGHKGFINNLRLFEIHSKQNLLYSASNDGSIKVWNYQSTECIQNIIPQSSTPGKSFSISNIIPLNSEGTSMIICDQDQQVKIINQNGETIRKIGIEKTELKTQFCYAAISPKKQLLYTIGSNNILYCFSMLSGLLEQSIKIAEKDEETLGLEHHPTQNQLIVYLSNGHLLFLAP